MSAKDARRALRSVGVDLSKEELLKATTGDGAPPTYVSYDRLRRRCAATAGPSNKKKRPAADGYARLYADEKKRRSRAIGAESALVARMATAAEVAPLRRRLRGSDAGRAGHLAPRDFVRALHAHYGPSALDNDEADALCVAYGGSRPSKNHTVDDDAVKAALTRSVNPEEVVGLMRHHHAIERAPGVDYEAFVHGFRRARAGTKRRDVARGQLLNGFANYFGVRT